jgi:hypothetical protein
MSPTVAELHAAKIQPKSSLTFAKFMSIMSSHFTQRKKNAGAGILAAFKVRSFLASRAELLLRDPACTPHSHTHPPSLHRAVL